MKTKSNKHTSISLSFNSSLFFSANFMVDSLEIYCILLHRQDSIINLDRAEMKKNKTK